MPHLLRSYAVAGSLVVLGLVLGGCGSSSEGGAPATTTRPSTTTTAAPATTSSTTTTTDGEATTTTTASGSTTTSPTATELPACRELLTEYSAVFTPDDLSGAVTFFRKYAPFMPPEVKAAVLRIADAYDGADDQLDNLDFSDVDLTADAQTFSDWTNDGCPSG
jgi:hypothetical protein